ncbi:hypothetical protein J5X84_36380 [Streptosporangiaceae bacterium NEAU-GS5]|nr:hypothetical protein [Streptosporangiaceae bacterium NEAU-GS5]
MTARSRAKCPVCSRELALRLNGTPRSHCAPGSSTWCEGSYLKPERDGVRIRLIGARPLIEAYMAVLATVPGVRTVNCSGVIESRRTPGEHRLYIDVEAMPHAQ